MVGWYDPLQLLDAGIKSLVSNIVGERSDQRIVQALANRRPEYYDYTFHYRDGRGGPYVDATRPREEIWIDYVCDTGDGWNSTYAVAYTASQHTLDVAAADDDSALPAPARRPAGLWRRRGLSDPQPRRVSRPADRPLGDGGRRHPPRRVATRVRDPRQPRLVRRPERVCATLLLQRRRPSLRGLAHSPAPQLLRPEASLPLVADRIGRTAAGGYRHARRSNTSGRSPTGTCSPGDRVIVCLASPVWVQAHKYREFGAVFDETDLLYLRDEVFARRGVQMSVFLAGDNHHYRRHAGNRSPRSLRRRSRRSRPAAAGPSSTQRMMRT